MQWAEKDRLSDLETTKELLTKALSLHKASLKQLRARTTASPDDTETESENESEPGRQFGSEEAKAKAKKEAEEKAERKAQREIQKKAEVFLLNKILDHVQAMAMSSSIVATEAQILKSLFFAQMHMRQDAIKNTYSDTFMWIFEDTTTDFKTWLEKEAGIFWARGKAGSGKSTLMKLLSNHPQTSAILDIWAGPKKLVKVSCTALVTC